MAAWCSRWRARRASDDSTKTVATLPSAHASVADEELSDLGGAAAEGGAMTSSSVLAMLPTEQLLKAVDPAAMAAR